ncbi:hypothetical protein BDFB_012719 [Asbolus verrucosus]|uniref:Uncharacterized protein n=1 Tax=Asbolus verrucosus TaxID=1661398 RepID=A0A482VQI0_ASBVE|nr:hypothetical protein BDFB_012719 [Asbolus verrucosus]
MDLQIIKILFNFGKILALTPSPIEERSSNCLGTPIELILKIFIDIGNYTHNLYFMIILNVFRRKKWYKFIKNLEDVRSNEKSTNL